MQIIPIVLTSSFLSSVLTSAINWLIQKNNYKNEYYKKILDRRLDAYENVETLIASMKVLIHSESGQLCNDFCSFGKSKFDGYMNSIVLVITKSLWLNPEISNLLSEYNVFLLQNIEYKIDKNINCDDELERLGILNRDKIQDFRHKIENLLYKDLKNLHKIKAFFAQKRDLSKILINLKET